MALVLDTLVADLTDALDMDVSFDNTVENQATKIATAIDKYLRSAKVTVTIEAGILSTANPLAPPEDPYVTTGAISDATPGAVGGVGDPTTGTGGLT